MFRVKVYELDAASNWVDKGTGTASVEWVEAKESSCIIIKPEDQSTEGLLMNSSIRQDFDTYSRQQDTLIVWTEPDGVDLALSFQDINGCNEIWATILETQKRMRADKHDIDQLPLSTDGT
jgi:protein phosphatase-4 regulatory subunit 3